MVVDLGKTEGNNFHEQVADSKNRRGMWWTDFGRADTKPSGMTLDKTQGL